ncbi:hypothetical protein BYT27DRAFT_7176265 [Phlegmacium glaucopus]|nr:hypothetical protein BYT27DRAFT_7176265 [Phlegmacium glaucopus]
MKFSALSVATILAFFSGTMAEPLPQTGPTTTACSTKVFYCGGPCQLQCPVGWRCCSAGPISEDFGGTCFLGLSGPCPV